EEIKNLFKDSIKTIKKLGILTAYTIAQMPLEENYDNDLAQILYEGFKEVMKFFDRYKKDIALRCPFFVSIFVTFSSPAGIPESAAGYLPHFSDR
ncbi:MAG: hypothetical protein IIY19_03490, partial [Lachnospiraceae bacterium]|nr:hypothetical protein [Lachnospiraceae bacterium]